MRRPAVLLALLVALAAASSAPAARAPGQDRSGRTRVIVTLELPPLAAASLTRRMSAAGFGAVRRLNVHDASSRAYLARLDAAQRSAVAVLRREIPEARVQERYRVVLDGMAVDLPARRLPALYRLGFVDKIYPSLRYSLSLNRAPGIIGAPQFTAATGANGEGIKVAVVDDGIDYTSSFLNPAGYSYPPGFPKGNSEFTTPKVIAARDFPAPASTAGGQLPLDREQSFHATFVSGVIAGNAGTNAPASNEADCKLGGGKCHPPVAGLSGVAPRAWLGNYRVFNVPSPLGGCCQGNTPEIAAAFEAAVTDGMDVINFSGGGPQTDPSTDALMQTVANVTKAGVLAVISAGNDRDLFGLGTVGSPSTAPEAISVAAVTNEHVFGRAMTLVSPDVASLKQVPIVPAPGGIPASWANDRPLVDVGTVSGGDRLLCGPSLPAQSLQGAVALVWSGGCAFRVKAARAAAAGATGVIIVGGTPGDPAGIQIGLGLPGGMIADLDGARLRDALAQTGGRGVIRVGTDEGEIVTNRGNIPTSFSSAGPTPFGHLLKPDLSAPGAQIVSSVPIEYASSGFAVLDGTSFSAPHVAGAVALLLQRHRSWSPGQLKSALMSTAGPVFGDTARTQEASVYLEGAGLARIPAADDPKIFTAPQSLSLQDLNVVAGPASRSLLVTVSDAGGGSGDWQVELRPQSATAGAGIDIPSSVSVAPGGQATFQVTAHASADAAAGDDVGFVVLRRGGDVRRLPYAFSVERPQLTGAETIPIKRIQTGTTAEGVDRAHFYRFPTRPFGGAGLLGVDQPTIEDGKEKVYVIDLAKKTTNFGVAVVDPRPNIGASLEALFYANAPIQPWLLGSLDENDVLGIAGTPVNANSLMPSYLFADGSAGTTLAPPGKYYVVVDSTSDPFTGASLAGRYTLRYWVDDVKPPRVQLVTAKVSAGRPTIVAKVTDAGAGVDPLSLLLLYKDLQVGASAFDPATGIAVFPFPRNTNPLPVEPGFMKVVASDYQEAKNANVAGDNLMPNTAFKGVRLNVVAGASVTWIAPAPNACVRRGTPLQVAASSRAVISSVIFYDGARAIARVKKNSFGVYRTTWSGRAAKGKHTLSAVVADVAGREARSPRVVRFCG